MTDGSQVQTVTIDEVEYQIEDLSDEVKELLSLHAQANDMMVGARRQAVIHEVSVTNLASLISQRVKSENSDDAAEVIESECLNRSILGGDQPNRFPRSYV